MIFSLTNNLNKRNVSFSTPLVSLFDILFICATKRKKYFTKPEWQLKNADQTGAGEQAQYPACKYKERIDAAHFRQFSVTYV